MRDWQQIVRQHLQPGALPSAHRDEVIAELAAHLEEVYEQARSERQGEQAAFERALKEVPDWNALGANIRRATQESHSMNKRTKTVWLPGIAILFTVGLLLLFLDRAAVVQRLIWLACMALLLCAARSEADRLHPRTRSILLPGFVSLTAASLFMLAGEVVLLHDPSFYFTELSLRPDHWASSVVFRFYCGWLVTQTLCGAAGAFLSRSAQGSPRARVLAAAFPAVVMFGLWVVVIPMSALAEHNAFLWNHPLYYLLGIFVWVVPPGIALVAGAVPFLRDMRPVEA